MPRIARKMRALPVRIDYVHNMPRLVVSGTAHELVEDLVTIGRGPDNMIVINDPSVSTRHAQLQRAGETYLLKDLESANGTLVNGIPVAETGLRFGDRIRFGAAEARYEQETHGSQPLPQAEGITAKSAELSAVPADFINASPFRQRKKDKDPLRAAIFIALAGLALIFLGSMIAVLTMHAPAF
jgi:pSer/pThr/pTyr-binding forkhead associated (FHA) protein